MPAQRVFMRRIREVLRLKHEAKLGRNRIAEATGISHGAVSRYLERAERAGVSWPLPAEMDDSALERLLFPEAVAYQERQPLNFVYLKEQLHNKIVTRQLLWEEYQEANPGNAYGRSRFCELFRDWQKRQNVTMRQIYKAGDKEFVDYAGQTVPVINPKTGEIKDAQIFVAVLGASNYTFAEATWTQEIQNWIESNQRAFEFFGGVPALVVPDNLKSGVKKANRYEPDLNDTFEAFLSHYNTTALPARVRKPRDKAKVEGGVLVVERWILARLRHQQFFSLAELNEAIKKLLFILNNKPFKKFPGSRWSQFEAIDKPALKSLPATRFDFFILKKVRAGLNYHIRVEDHFYSVPYTLAHQKMEARITARSVEVLHKGVRVILHERSLERFGYTTLPQHMPEHHRACLQWTPGRFLNWALTIGPSTVKVVHALLEGRQHPAQAYNSCWGLLRLAKVYTSQRLEAGCLRAVALGTLNYKSVNSILDSGFDSQPLPQPSTQEELFTDHSNLRGSRYYA